MWLYHTNQFHAYTHTHMYSAPSLMWMRFNGQRYTNDYVCAFLYKTTYQFISVPLYACLWELAHCLPWLYRYTSTNTLTYTRAHRMHRSKRPEFNNFSFIHRYNLCVRVFATAIVSRFVFSVVYLVRLDPVSLGIIMLLTESRNSVRLVNAYTGTMNERTECKRERRKQIPRNDAAVVLMCLYVTINGHFMR